jgi:hypothetical protein
MFSKNRFLDRTIGVLLTLALVLTSFAVAPQVALAHHPTGIQQADCEGYEVSGSFVGGSGYRWWEWNVDVTVDGVLTNYSGALNGVFGNTTLFSATGTGPHDVLASGYIREFNDVSVSADTRTYTRSGDDTETGVVINFFDNDKQVSITATGGYYITFVGIDYTGSDSNDVTFGPQSSPFVYDAPGTNDIEHVTVTVHRDASHTKGTLDQQFTFNLSFVAQCSQEIEAKALCDHQVNWDEWHFVITGITGGVEAPASIHVEWSNGSSENVPLDGVTGNVAHYTTTSNLDADVTSATAVISSAWDGQFNLSHGPACGPDHDYSYEVEQWNHCDRWERSARLLDFGVPVGPFVVVDSGVWPWDVNHFLDAGDVPAQTYNGVDLGEGQVFDITFPAMAEPEGCQETHVVTFDVVNDCQGVSATYSIDGGAPVEFFNYGWVDPYDLESVTIPEYTVPMAPGEVYDDPVFEAQLVNEPEECQGRHVVTWDWTVDCEGVVAWYQVDGGAPVEFFNHTWTNPFALESVNIPTFDLPVNPGELYSQTTVGGEEGVQEPEECQVNEARTSVSGQCVTDGIGESHYVFTAHTTNAKVLFSYGGNDYELADGETIDVPQNTAYSWLGVANEGASFPNGVPGNEGVTEECGLEGATVLILWDPCIYRDGVSWVHLHITINGKGTFYLYQDETLIKELSESSELTLPAGKYQWEFEPAEGYQVVGSDHGELDLVTCKPEKPVTPPTNGQGFTMDVVGAVVTTTIEPGKETGEPGGLERMLERYGAHLLQPFLERIQVWAAALKAKAWWNPAHESFFLRTLTHRPIADRTFEITVDNTSQGPALTDGFPYLWMGLPHSGQTGALFYGRKVRMGPPVCLEPGHHIPMHGGFGATAWIGASPVIGTPEEMAEVDENNLTFCQDLGAMLYKDAVHAGLVTADSWWIYGNNSLENALGEAGATSLYAYYLGENPDLTQIWQTGMVYSPNAVEPWNGREGGLPIWGWTPEQGFNADKEKVRAMFNVVLPPADFLGHQVYQQWATDYEARGFKMSWTLTERINFYLKTYGDLR